MVCGLRIFRATATVCVWIDGVSSLDADVTTGAVIYAENSLVTIRNCFFYSNTALMKGRGSAIFSLNSSISIEYSVFYNHLSQGNGGVIYAGQNSHVAIQGSFFESNICNSRITKLCGLCQHVFIQTFFRFSFQW